MPFPSTYSSDLQRSAEWGNPATDVVPQKSSWVGLGFELETPYIARIVRGGPDNCEGNENAIDYDYNQLSALRTELCSPVLGGNYTLTRLWYNYPNYLPLFTPDGKNNYFSPACPGSCYPSIPTMPSWSYYDGIPDGLNQFLAAYRSAVECPAWEYQEGDRAGTLWNQQTLQDVYVLRNFPAGDRQLYFTTPASNNVALKVNTVPYAPWKISYTVAPASASGPDVVPGDILQWTIVDENGTVYTFGGSASGGWPASLV